MTNKFKPGKSGNPKGRPVGIIDRRTKWRDTLRAELPDLLKRLVVLARAGDVQALKLILDRVAPPLRPQAEPVEIPAVATAVSLGAKARAVLDALGAGQLTADSAADVLAALGSIARIVEHDELAARIAALETSRHD